MVIRFEKHGNDINVKLDVENPVSATKIKRILEYLEVENPMITYGDDTNNICAEMGSNIYYLAMNAWRADNGKMYSGANALILLKNALKSVIRLEREKEDRLSEMVSGHSKITPCLDFDGSLPKFSVSAETDFAHSLWKNTKINFRTIVTCGKELSTEEMKFVEMLSDSLGEISLNELIQKMISMLWVQFNDNKG
ncbi:MAG: hypothetical protein IJ419_12995 [Agathobacter sp.]|nr:hypothetical protein [Agathobacter sp.]